MGLIVCSKNVYTKAWYLKKGKCKEFFIYQKLNNPRQAIVFSKNESALENQKFDTKLSNELWKETFSQRYERKVNTACGEGWINNFWKNYSQVINNEVWKK